MEPACNQDFAGTRVSRYAIVELVASGGMGCVYRARDEWLQRDVAIKVRNRQPGSNPHEEPPLVVEARALSRLSHPHIAAIYDFIAESRRDFIVMEFVPGATVKELLAGGPLPFAEVVRLGRQMMQGLSAAHEAQLVHRDIKPANLKVTASGDLKILDFGLAELMPPGVGIDRSRDLCRQSHPEFGLIGTMPYMAPEQLCGERADERSDIFSAGAVLYEMATAHQAFPQTTTALVVDAILHQHPVGPSTCNPLVPPQFDGVVGKAMEKLPSRRYQTAVELEVALNRLPVVRHDASSATRAHRRPGILGWLRHDALNRR